MERGILSKKVNDFLNTEKSGDGKNLSKTCREALVKFISDLLYAEVKELTEKVPMKESIPESDASVISKFKHKIGVEVYYILFKKVKVQKSNSLQITYGWQFDVLKGRTEEIQVRNDHGILYKINGDWVLQDLTFADEIMAKQRCNELNVGTTGAVMFDVPPRDTKVPITDNKIEHLFTDDAVEAAAEVEASTKESKKESN